MLDTIACIHPSFFELTMMLAFMYFAEEKVDIAVIETGLGGRLDSTNIISPELVVITNISFDHTQFLGNTLPEIAAEKAGIIKPHIPVVIGEAGNSAVRHVFETKASEVNARICFAEDMPKVLSAEIKSGYQIFQTTDYPNLTCGLTGFYQQKNANTVLTVIEKLKSINITIPDVAVYEGFKDVQPLTSLAGRWQKLQDNPCVICDTGHNEAGIEFVIKQLKSMKYSKLRIVFGLVNDKDTAKIIALLPDDAVYYFTKASVQRALDEEELHRIASTRGLCGMAYPSVCHAIRNALHDSDSDNLVFIGGSNFIVADALLYYESEKSIS
jgi:dihydrofolate synthase/folylpolyglutamate synthase